MAVVTRHNIAAQPPPPAGTCHVTASRGSRIVHISGQVGADENGTVVPGLAAQTEYALRNVALAVEAAGARVSDLVHLRIYVVGWNQSMWDEFAAGARVAVERRGLPEVSSTLLGVASLFTPEMLIEVEAVAVTD